MTRYHRARSVSEARGVLESVPGAVVLAGGQTLLPYLLPPSATVVDIGSIEQLTRISEVDGAIEVGATVTHAAVESSSLVRRALPELARLVGAIADPLVRNRGTIGGAIVTNDPIGDYPAACLAFDARITTDRRTVPVDDFLAGPSPMLSSGELVTSVHFPSVKRAAFERFPNHTMRGVLVGVVLAVGARGVRVAVTGVAATGAFRWQAAEEILNAGGSPRGLSLEVAAPLSDEFGSAEYRAGLMAALLGRAVARILS